MWKLREIQDKVTNVVMSYTEVEAKVREATNEDPWGPHGTIMSEIAAYTYTYEQFPEAMSMLWKRMLDKSPNWRRTYKSLLLLTYLVRNGSEKVVTSAREHLYDLRALENYKFVDEVGKDQGVNIRNKVKDLVALVQDSARLRDERRAAKKTRDKYVGVSSAQQSSYSGGSEPYDQYGGGGGRAGAFHDATPDASPRRTRKPVTAEYHDSEEEDGAAPPERFSPFRDVDSPPRASPLATRSKKPSSAKTLDMGKAANLAASNKAAPAAAQPPAQQQQASSLLDIAGGTETSDPFGLRGQAPDDFTDLASARSTGVAQPAAPGGNGFTDFTDFQSSTSTSANSSFVSAQPAAPAQPSATPLMPGYSPQQVLMPMGSTSQPATSTAAMSTPVSAAEPAKPSSDLHKWTDSTGVNISLDFGNKGGADKKMPTKKVSMNELMAVPAAGPGVGATMSANPSAAAMGMQAGGMGMQAGGMGMQAGGIGMNAGVAGMGMQAGVGVGAGGMMMQGGGANVRMMSPGMQGGMMSSSPGMQRGMMSSPGMQAGMMASPGMQAGMMASPGMQGGMMRPQGGMQAGGGSGMMMGGMNQQQMGMQGGAGGGVNNYGGRLHF
eukprot:scpid38346/ scgid2234/ Clathrin interactor 1; Clathrin-interacting protein localized in the trans-Golgi region; Enthoprotin; Epsin-4; Epsin-related protein